MVIALGIIAVAALLYNQNKKPKVVDDASTDVTVYNVSVVKSDEDGTSAGSSCNQASCFCETGTGTTNVSVSVTLDNCTINAVTNVSAVVTPCNAGSPVAQGQTYTYGTINASAQSSNQSYTWQGITIDSINVAISWGVNETANYGIKGACTDTSCR